METHEMLFRSLGNQANLTVKESGKENIPPYSQLCQLRRTGKNPFRGQLCQLKSSRKYIYIYITRSLTKHATCSDKPGEKKVFVLLYHPKGLRMLSSDYWLTGPKYCSHSCNRTPALWHVTIQY